MYEILLHNHMTETCHKYKCMKFYYTIIWQKPVTNINVWNSIYNYMTETCPILSKLGSLWHKSSIMRYWSLQPDAFYYKHFLNLFNRCSLYWVSSWFKQRHQKTEFFQQTLSLPGNDMIKLRYQKTKKPIFFFSGYILVPMTCTSKMYGSSSPF